MYLLTNGHLTTNLHTVILDTINFFFSIKYDTVPFSSVKGVDFDVTSLTKEELQVAFNDKLSQYLESINLSMPFKLEINDRVLTLKLDGSEFTYNI